MRKHSWGERFSDRLQCYSWVTVQFRDMSMDLTYFRWVRSPIHRALSRAGAGISHNEC